MDAQTSKRLRARVRPGPVLLHAGHSARVAKEAAVFEGTVLAQGVPAAALLEVVSLRLAMQEGRAALVAGEARIQGAIAAERLPLSRATTTGRAVAAAAAAASRPRATAAKWAPKSHFSWITLQGPEHAKSPRSRLQLWQ